MLYMYNMLYIKNSVILSIVLCLPPTNNRPVPLEKEENIIKKKLNFFWSHKLLTLAYKVRSYR